MLASAALATAEEPQKAKIMLTEDGLSALPVDVKLSKEDMHRITVWLDSCSVFYGVYEKEGGIAQLEGKVVYPTLQ